jgi:hypothetical protein
MMHRIWKRRLLGSLFLSASLIGSGFMGPDLIRTGNAQSAPPAASESNQEAGLLRGFAATYEAYALGSTLVATKTLSWNGEEGELRLQGRVRGLLRLIGRFEMERVSTFRVHDGNIQLLSSRAWQASPNRERSHSLRRIEEEGVFVGEIDGDLARVEIDSLADIQDFLSVLHWSRAQLTRHAGDLADVSVTILERDRLRSYAMQAFPSESIRTPLGVLDAVRLVREDRERETSLSAWFAPSMDYLPVRIDYDIDGRILSLKLTQIEWY